MIVLVQRVSQAEVSVKGEIKGCIGKGLLLLVGLVEGDTELELQYCASKCANLRIFEDENGKMNLSLIDLGAEILCVSQFTLGAKVRKGRRPSFDKAMKPPQSKELFEKFCDLLKEESCAKIETGVFGANMQVSLVNDGPVTIIVDSGEKRN